MSHIITQQMLDDVQAAYDAGNLPDNKLRVLYNHDIIVNQGEYYIFYDLVTEVAELMGKDAQAILTNMYSANNFYDVLSIFHQEFGSRILLSSGAENIEV